MFDVYEPGPDSTYLPFPTALEAAAFLGVKTAEVPRLAESGSSINGFCVRRRADGKVPTRCIVYTDERCLLKGEGRGSNIGIPVVINGVFYVNLDHAQKALGVTHHNDVYESKGKRFTMSGRRGRWATEKDVLRQYPGIEIRRSDRVSWNRRKKKRTKAAAKPSAAKPSTAGGDLLDLAISYLEQDIPAAALSALKMHRKRYGDG